VPWGKEGREMARRGIIYERGILGIPEVLGGFYL